MAKISLETSDDELPELDAIFRGEITMGGKKLGGISKTTSTVRPGVTSRSQEVSKTSGKKDGTSRRKEREIEGDGVSKHEVQVVEPATKPRKRILKQTTENPLLRPIMNTTMATSSEKSVRQKITKTIIVEETEIMPKRKRVQTKPRECYEECEDEEDLSDFVVHDDSTILIEETEAEEEEEEELMIKKPVSRSARKLVRGRRPERKDSVDDDLEPGMGRSNVGDSQDSKDLVQKGGKKPDFKSAKTDAMENRKPSRENTSASERKGLPEQMEVKTLPATNRRKVDGPSALPLIISKSKTKEKEKAISKKKPQPPSSDLDDPFTLRFSPPATKPRNTTKETRFATPPSSPKLKPLGFVSPFKQIPATPHRQSEDAFWSQGVINDWNDEYSPQKKLLPTPKLKSSLDDEGSEGNLLFSPTKMSPVKQDRVTKYAKKAFEQKKHALADSFLAELDDKITNGRISELAGSTGGVKIIWNKKLNSTAGRANWKRETIKSSKLRADGNPAPPTIRNHASIELAEKVIDDEDRLLNVIAHEFCHLANFMVSNIRNNPHGKEFQAWGSNCSREFSSRGIKVTTKHSYAIDYKYIWECQNSTCAIEYKRHSKSIDPIRHQCGKCKGKLVQVKPVPKKVVEGKPKINAYQAFVKEHMKVVREENPGSPQKEIMGLVSRRYKEYKASQLGRKDGEEKGGSKERKPDVEDDSMGNVARKLDFLDLTSP